MPSAPIFACWVRVRKKNIFGFRSELRNRDYFDEANTGINIDYIMKLSSLENDLSIIQDGFPTDMVFAFKHRRLFNQIDFLVENDPQF